MLRSYENNFVRKENKNNDFIQQLISHAMGFLMTTECQDLGLMSHLKDGAFLTV